MPLTPLQSLEHLTDKVWDSWSGERLSDGVRESESFYSLAYDLGGNMNVSDDRPLSNAGDKIQRSIRSLEKQTRSWRTAVNLSQEGYEMDIDRWVGDLAKTRDKITGIQTALGRAERKVPAARASGEYISAGLDADEFEKAYLAGERTKNLIDEAIKAGGKVSRTASVGRVARRYAKIALNVRDEEKPLHERNGVVFLESTHTYGSDEEAKKAAEAQRKGKIKGVDRIRVEQKGRKVMLTLEVRGELDSVKKKSESLRESAFDLAFNALEG